MTEVYILEFIIEVLVLVLVISFEADDFQQTYRRMEAKGHEIIEESGSFW